MSKQAELDKLFHSLVNDLHTDDEQEKLKEAIQAKKNEIFIAKLNKEVAEDRKKLNLTKEQAIEYDKVINHYSDMLREQIDNDILLEHQEIADHYNRTGVNLLEQEEELIN